MSSKLCPFCMRTAEGDTCPHCGKNTNYAGMPTHLPAGYVVSGAHPYVIGAALGQGGFGITYIALDMVSGERVAIKEYFPTFCASRTSGTISAYPNQEEIFQKGRERFLDEARVLKSLSDLKSVVNVLDFFEFNNSAYLVMEFLDGISLKDYAAQNGKFPTQTFLLQIRPLMEDIHRMHQRGVVHRDIAPDNIILMPDGQMKLIDFGAARSFVGDRSMTVVVKKGFAPVEQYLSKGSNANTDVYALAATIYYCITGTVPMDSAERQYDDAPLLAPSSLGADITQLQEKALSKALEIQQKVRTQSVQEFADQLFAIEPAMPNSDPLRRCIGVRRNCGTSGRQCKSQNETQQLQEVEENQKAVLQQEIERKIQEKQKQEQQWRELAESLRDERKKRDQEERQVQTEKQQKKSVKRHRLVLSVCLMGILAFIIFLLPNGWKKTNDEYFYYRLGMKARGETTIDGKEYYFDSKGVMHKGWYNRYGKYYYYGPDGSRQTGWKTIDGNRYYFDEFGLMQTGFVDIDNSTFYFTENGIMLTGMTRIGNKTYYFCTETLDDSHVRGAMWTGWKTIYGSLYYFKQDGVMATGQTYIDGKLYQFSDGGQLA